VPHQMVDKF